MHMFCFPDVINCMCIWTRHLSEHKCSVVRTEEATVIKHSLAEKTQQHPEASQVLEHIAGPSLLVHHPVLSIWVFFA